MNAIDLLKQHNIKYSKQREHLLTFLMSRTLPVSITDCYQELNQEKQKVDLSTIYRNLDVLVEKGLVIKTMHMEQNQCTYDFNRHDHRHYLICKQCHEIKVLEGCPIHEYEEEVEKNSNYVITGHQLELYGICPNCQEDADSSSSTTGQ